MQATVLGKSSPSLGAIEEEDLCPQLAVQFESPLQSTTGSKRLRTVNAGVYIEVKRRLSSPGIFFLAIGLPSSADIKILKFV